MTVKVRFAPSPTGLLHVGNTRAALMNWLYARHTGGVFILRLDDTDTARGTPEFEEAIRQDLRWLGLEWDETFRQSERLARYDEIAERLKASGRLYPCFESEDELRVKRELRIKRQQAPIYDRAMLKLTPEQRANAEAGGKKPYWRFKLSDGEVTWMDLVSGRRRVKLTAISDPVLIRADGRPLYDFASVIDDMDSGISHIMRGEDHITNTGVQMDIISAIGGNPGAIAFGHLPLLLDDDGGKLSKRLGSLSLRSLRHDGIEPMAITSYLARVGSSADPEPLPLTQLAEDFDFSRLSTSGARFDVSQLLALNRRVLHHLPFEAVADRLPHGATEAFWNAVRGNLDLLGEARGYWDVVAGQIVPPVIENEGEFFRQALELLPPEPWNDDIWQLWTEALKAATGRKGRALFLPLRLALTGEDHGPELKALLPLIGRARASQRLQIAAN
ncbi:MAG TPA: glutamate--tRNA ligase [Acetobacteraceae bacterium]|jgi:glutamyl-tRNA synthetase